MIPLAIAMQILCPIFRSISVKITWEIVISYSSGQDLGNIWGKHEALQMEFISSAKPVSWHEAH